MPPVKKISPDALKNGSVKINAKEVEAIKNNLLRAQIDYENKKRSKEEGLNDILVKKMADKFVMEMRRDLNHASKSGKFNPGSKIVLVEFLATKNLTDRSLDHYFLDKVLATSGKSNGDVTFVSDLKTSGVSYSFSEKEGLSIQRGINLGDMTSKYQTDLYGSITYSYVGDRNIAHVTVKRGNETLFEKEYNYRIRQYGYFSMGIKRYRLGFGGGAIFPFLQTTKTPKKNIMITTNLFFASYLPSIGELGGKLTFGIVKRLDLFKADVFFALDLLEVAKNPHNNFSLFWQFGLGFGGQFLNEEISGGFFSLNTGIKFSFGDVFYLEGGVEVFMSKGNKDNQFYWYNNPVIPPSIYIGAGFYII